MEIFCYLFPKALYHLSNALVRFILFDNCLEKPIMKPHLEEMHEFREDEDR